MAHRSQFQRAMDPLNSDLGRQAALRWWLFLAETRLEPRRKRVNAKRVKFPTRVTTDGHKSGSRGDKFALGCSIRIGPIQPCRPTLTLPTSSTPSHLSSFGSDSPWNIPTPLTLTCQINTASMQSFNAAVGRAYRSVRRVRLE